MEKIIKKAKKMLAQSGGFSIAMGSILLAVAIPIGIISIVNGSRLLNLRKQL